MALSLKLENNQTIYSTSLLNSLCYVLDVVKPLNETWRSVVLKNEKLETKWHIKIEECISKLTILRIATLKEKGDIVKHKLAAKYSIDKNRLLICLILVLVLDSLSSYKKSKISVNFDSLLNGIAYSIKHNKIFHSEDKLINEIVGTTYQLIDKIVNLFEPEYMNEHSLTNVGRFFNDSLFMASPYINAKYNKLRCEVTEESSYYNLSTKEYMLYSICNNIYTSELYKETLSYLSNHLSLHHISITSSSSSLFYLINTTLFIDDILNLITPAIITNEYKRSEKDNSYIFDYVKFNSLKTKIREFDFLKNNFVIKAKDIGEDYEPEEVALAIKSYSLENSNLIKELYSKIEELNSLPIMFKHRINLKIKKEKNKNDKIKEYRLSGRQCNYLCDLAANEPSKEESERGKLLNELDYDIEGIDAPSSIYNVAISLITKTPTIDVNIKKLLVNNSYADIEGNIVTNQKLFKPLQQICFFNDNPHIAYATYNTPQIREEFSKHMRIEQNKLPVFSQNVFFQIFYFLKGLIGNNTFSSSIFLYESLLQLNTMIKCYKNGLHPLNVYDCIFLPNREKDRYSQVVSIYKDEMRKLINFYHTNEYEEDTSFNLWN